MQQPEAPISSCSRAVAAGPAYAAVSNASISRMRAFCGFSSSDAMKPSSSSLSSTLRPTEPVATRELRTTGTPLLATLRRGLHRRRVHVAVADARDHDAFRAALGRGGDRIGRHVRVGVDDVDARQRGHARDVELAARRVPPRRKVVPVVVAVARDADQAAHRRQERLDRRRARLRQRVRGMDPVVHDDHDAAALRGRIDGDADRVVEVQRAVGADGRRRAHRADQHDGLVALDDEVQEERRLLQACPCRA